MDKVYEKIKNFASYSSSYLKIRDKKGEIISFNFNKAQKKIDKIVEDTIAEDKLLRFIVLKARQEGVSTYFEGRIFHHTSTNFNVKASIIGHEQESADNLFDMFNRYYDNLPEPLQPIKKYSNRKELSFEKLLSEISINSADSGEKLKRSDTIQVLHCTEVAFWRDAKQSMLALLQTVPDELNTMVVLESTANGIGGWFFDTWQKAVRGENNFIPIFLAWYELPDYKMAFRDKRQQVDLIKSLTGYELKIMKRFDLSYEQMHWYRYTLTNKCNGDMDQMKQEYPTTPEEAFIKSGRPVFDADICYENYLNAKSPVKQGDLIFIYDTTAPGKKIIDVEFVSNSRGYIKIYDEISLDGPDYKEYNVYCAGCDVAEGLEQGDYSVIKVMDRRTRKVILTWHGHIDADLLAEEQMKIQMYLKQQVFFCTEFNNHGQTTVYEAYKLKVNQYYRTSYQKGYEVAKDMIGFKTSESTKPYIINALLEQIRDRSFTDYEQEFWDECLTFVKDSKGKMSAQNKNRDPGIKCFDDRVLAEALMFECDRWMPGYWKKEIETIRSVHAPTVKNKNKLSDPSLRM